MLSAPRSPSGYRSFPHGLCGEVCSTPARARVQCAPIHSCSLDFLNHARRCQAFASHGTCGQLVKQKGRYCEALWRLLLMFGAAYCYAENSQGKVIQCNLPGRRLRRTMLTCLLCVLHANGRLGIGIVCVWVSFGMYRALLITLTEVSDVSPLQL